MSKRMVFMGAGAVGGYIGGHITRTGEDVTLIDPWPEHIEYIKHNGIHLSGTQGELTVRLKALHLHEVQSLFKEPVDIAFILVRCLRKSGLRHQKAIQQYWKKWRALCWMAASV
jgi:2-dehydropantoate 2-reductase